MPNAQLRTVETNVNHQEKQTIFYCTYYTKAASIIVQEHHCNSLQDYKEDECRCQNIQKIIQHLGKGSPNSDFGGNGATTTELQGFVLPCTRNKQQYHLMIDEANETLIAFKFIEPFIVMLGK